MGKIILVGTNHGDINGYERLESLLTTVKPDILSVEFSPDSLRLLEDNSTEISKLISEMKAQNISGEFIRFFKEVICNYGLEEFEYSVARAYSHKQRIPLYLSDDPTLAQTLLNTKFKMLRDIINSIPLDTKIPTPTEEDLSKENCKSYAFAQAVLKGEIRQSDVDKFLDKYRGTLIGQRDAYMEHRIREISTDQPNSRLVHICGFAHLFDDSRKETIYARIKDLKPERRLIYTR